MAWIIGCGPSIGVSSPGSFESTTSAETTTTLDSVTVSATSLPSTSASSTTGSADITSGETTTALDLGGASSDSGENQQCAACGPDEICLEVTGDDTCDPGQLPCVPVPVECEIITCDDPDCALALCGENDCFGYAARGCYGAPDSFVCQTPASTIECGLFWQDCPEDEKCVSWSEGAGEYDGTRCAPLAKTTVGVGEACMVQDYATSGLDDCEVGAQCLDVEPETLLGTCRAVCSGTPADPACDDPEMSCTIMGEYFAWCFP